MIKLGIILTLLSIPVILIMWYLQAYSDFYNEYLSEKGGEEE